jgi:hypothetical protein
MMESETLVFIDLPRRQAASRWAAGGRAHA